MLKEIQADMELIMKDFHKPDIDKKRRLIEEKKVKEQFLRDFEVVKHKAILPVMKEMSEFLYVNGHGAFIGNYTQQNIIFLNIIPEKKRCTSFPCIAFSAIDTNHKVSVHAKSFMPNREGIDKYLGEFSLKMITRSYVEKQIFNLIRDSFGWKNQTHHTRKSLLFNKRQ